MANIGLLPDNDVRPSAPRDGKFLTFILPAPDGCNLNCGFCLIRQRQEIAAKTLQPEDYARFIREVAAATPVYALAIQGYEPLLPATLPYTQAVLVAGRMLDIPTGLVTNGTHLSSAIGLLECAPPDTIAVSLDAASADAHDRLRGVTGAWAAAVDGIAHVATELPRTELAVNSVLIPSRRALLDGMAALLARLNIRRWIVTPLQKIGADRAGGPVGERQRLYRDLLALHEIAKREGIHLEVDDELDCLQHGRARFWRPALWRLRVRTIPRGVELVRLLPNGECFIGRDILRRAAPGAPCWNPAKETAAAFLERQTLEYRQRVQTLPGGGILQTAGHSN